jgi:hypothetical protein
MLRAPNIALFVISGCLAMLGNGDSRSNLTERQFRPVNLRALSRWP